jgi:3-hydroxyisobutyrate dehydrogenase-like beta-hydroxyacid dehydrogenase
MIFEHISGYAAGVIALWATWCVLSGKVRDGVLGKIIYSVIAFSGYAILARPERLFTSSSAAEATLFVALATAGVRHWFVTTYWKRVKAWICRNLNCEPCMHCDPRPEGQRVERRQSPPSNS